MMTCTSERSGSASSGVRLSAITPHAVTITVASTTRKRLAMDQRMRFAIISRPAAVPGAARRMPTICGASPSCMRNSMSTSAPAFSSGRSSPGASLKSMVMAGHFRGRNRRMAQGQHVAGDGLDQRAGAMGAAAAASLLAETRLDAREAGFGIDQELARQHYPLPGLQASPNLGQAARFDPGDDLGRAEATVLFGEHHQRAFAGRDDRLGRHEEHLVLPLVREAHPDEHARHQARAGIGEFHARLERSRRPVHLRQQPARARRRFRRAAPARRSHPRAGASCAAWLSGTSASAHTVAGR